MAIAVLNTVVIMPLDNLKTQKQLFHEDVTFNESYSQIIKRVHGSAGVRGFFVGWRLRFSLYLLHSFFNTTALEFLETKYRILINKL